MTIGHFIVSVLSGTRWIECCSIPAGREFVRQVRAISNDEVGDDVCLRVVAMGGKAAHIDSITVNEMPPVSVSGTVSPETDRIKLQALNNDLVDVTGLEVEMRFTLLPESARGLSLSLVARIDDGRGPQDPFLFPPANTHSKPTRHSLFYRVRLTRSDVTVEGFPLSEKPPLFKEWCECGTGHPDGYVYAWLSNDMGNLYVRVDVTPDSTQDGSDDYAKVFCRLRDGSIREFKCTTEEREWGTPSFTYTKFVDYQHNVYDFVIPLSMMGVSPEMLPADVDLMFAAYGTAAPPSTTFDTTRTELIGQARLSVYLNEEVEAFDVFSALNAAVASYLFNDHLGKYRYVAYVPPAGASLLQFTEDEIFSFSEDVDASKIISRVKAKFQHRVTRDYWQVRFVDRLQSQHLKRSPVPILKEIEFPFVQASDALKGGQRATLMEGVPQRVYKAKVSSKGWTLLPSNFIQATYARHGINGIFEVLETKRDLKTGKVDLVVGGLRGITGGGTSGGFGYPGHWCDDESILQ